MAMSGSKAVIGIGALVVLIGGIAFAVLNDASEPEAAHSEPAAAAKAAPVPAEQAEPEVPPKQRAEGPQKKNSHLRLSNVKTLVPIQQKGYADTKPPERAVPVEEEESE